MKELHGRRKITTRFRSINAANVLEMLRETSGDHSRNRRDMEYLWGCYTGKFDISRREKVIRPEICNRYSENRAKYIADFHTGWICSENIQYVTKSTDEAKVEQTAYINEKMVHLGMGRINNDIVHNGMVFGTAYKYAEFEEDGTIECASLDPRENYVVYDRGTISKPIAAVLLRRDEENNPVTYVFTATEFFTIDNEQRVYSDVNPFGRIPLIEYPANTARLGAFETVLPQINSINNLVSNALDGVEQFIQSLLVFYNCQLEENVTSQEIRENGMIFLKSTGDQKADLKEIASQLDQQQTEVLKTSMLKAMNEIAAVPSQSDGNTSDSSNNGAVILKNGFRHTEAMAKNYELFFDASETVFLALLLDMLETKQEITDLTAEEIAPKFPRRNYEDYAAKATVLTQMLGNENIHPMTAFEFCSMFPDAYSEYLKGQEWREKLKEENEASNGTVSAEI